MKASLPSLLLRVAVLLLASVLASKASSRFGVPPAASPFAGQRVLDLGLPGGVLMVLIDRQGAAIVPSAGTVVHEDKLLVLTGPNESSAVRSLFRA